MNEPAPHNWRMLLDWVAAYPLEAAEEIVKLRNQLDDLDGDDG